MTSTKKWSAHVAWEQAEAPVGGGAGDAAVVGGPGLTAASLLPHPIIASQSQLMSGTHGFAFIA
jgi:hypothetical protein